MSDVIINPEGWRWDLEKLTTRVDNPSMITHPLKIITVADRETCFMTHSALLIFDFLNVKKPYYIDGRAPALFKSQSLYRGGGARSFSKSHRLYREESSSHPVPLHTSYILLHIFYIIISSYYIFFHISCLFLHIFHIFKLPWTLAQELVVFRCTR